MTLETSIDVKFHVIHEYVMAFYFFQLVQSEFKLNDVDIK